PYRVVSALEDRLSAARLTRVVFTTDAQRSLPRELDTLSDAGLTMVLPDGTMPRINSMDIDPGNLLFLEVLPTGIVEARLGADPTVHEITPADVEEVWRREVAVNPRLIALILTHPAAEYR